MSSGDPFGSELPGSAASNPYVVGGGVRQGVPVGSLPGHSGPGQPGQVWKVDSSQVGDGTGGLIPYKNPKALLAYYLGIFSMFPLIGMPLGIASIILGIMGLKARNRNPIIKGSVHAWIGIVLGLLLMPVHILIAVAIGFAMVNAAAR
jgi:hypothetical protein